MNSSFYKPHYSGEGLHLESILPAFVVCPSSQDEDTIAREAMEGARLLLEEEVRMLIMELQ